jgi:hypothetical protein
MRGPHEAGNKHTQSQDKISMNFLTNVLGRTRKKVVESQICGRRVEGVIFRKSEDWSKFWTTLPGV